MPHIDGWKTTEKGQHFLVGEEGNIKAGFGGRYNGKELSNAFSTHKVEGSTKTKAGKKESTGSGGDKVVTKTGMKKSEVKKLVLEFEAFQDEMKKKYGKKVKIQKMTPSEYKRYSEMAMKMNSVPMQYRNRKDPKRFDSGQMEFLYLEEAFENMVSDINMKIINDPNSVIRVYRADSISLNQTYYTDEGYFVDHPIVTTCGIFEYKNSDGSTRRELRLPEDVFEEKSLESYKGKPIIITHDAGEVDKNNVRREQIGTIMSKGYRDGDNVRCEIIIHDTDALKRCGLKELSLGYSLDTDDTSGTYNGEKYDCIQKNIEINHLALVGEARAGESARLNIDGKDNIKFLKGGKVIMYKPNMKGKREDSEAELTPEEMEAAIALFKAQQAASHAAGEGADGEEDTSEILEEPEEKKNPVDQVKENIDRRDSEGKDMTPEDIIAAQKADLDTLLAEIDKIQAANDMNSGADAEDMADLEKENSDSEDDSGSSEEDNGRDVNMDSVDKIVKERLDVCRMADKLNLDGIETLSLSEGRKRVIKAVNSKINLDGKSDSYINAAYDIAKQSFSERKSTDVQRQRIVSDKMRRDAREESSSNSARKNMISRMTGGKR